MPEFGSGRPPPMRKYERRGAMRTGDFEMLRPTPPGVANTPMEIGQGWRPPGVADPRIGSFKKGGPVKKTGIAKLHKGERVLTAKQAKMSPAKGRAVKTKPMTRARGR